MQDESSASVSIVTTRQLTDSEIEKCLGTLENEIVVVFDMWGQRCVTTFNGTSELTPLKWLGIMKEKGWLLPIEIYEEATGVVLYDRDELEESFKEL